MLSQSTYTSTGDVTYEMYFLYDSYNHLTAIRYIDATKDHYYYVSTNIQGDALGIYTAGGVLLASYEYDAWGNGTLTTHNANYNIGDLNPIRYRGYYYDTDTELYYCNSRYYDAEIGRWINPEPNVDYGAFDEAAGLLGYNVYAYCANNPVVFKDETGEGIILACIIAFGIIGASAGGYAGYKIAQHYKIPKGQKWKYVLGGIVIGGASGVLLGWGAGVSISAFAAKAAGMALFGKVVTSGGMLVNLATQFFENTKIAINLSQVKQLITLCQKYGVEITARLVDLTKGHGAWTGIPHIHIGDKQIHIALTQKAVEYIRKLFGI